MKEIYIWILGLIIIAVVIYALPFGLDKTKVILPTKKVKSNIRFIVLADLHDAKYGKNMKRLIKPILSYSPDFILLPGDIFEWKQNKDNAWNLVSQLGQEKIPMLFSYGNHETFQSDSYLMSEKLKELGVIVLSHQCHELNINGETIEVVGVEDRNEEELYDAHIINQLFHNEDSYRIVMLHRPHYERLNKDIDCDMIVSGHAHGGQWCIPFTKKGFFAPQQGFFPKWTHGTIKLEDKTLLISRGLNRASYCIPRLFNRPELLLVELKPYRAISSK